MKKMSTLGFGILFSLASFANFAPSRLTVSTEGNANIKVTVDGNRFDQQSAGNSVVFNNLQPGYHAVSVYQITEKRFGLFNRRQADEYRLLYAATVNIRPLFSTTVLLNRFGKAQVNEQPMRGTYDNRGWDGNDRKDKGGYDNDHVYSNNDRNGHNDNYGNNGAYNKSGNNRVISNTDFFAAQRVMDRENDNGRLLFARRIVDENYLRAEQVKELARYFSFDDNRLVFIKYAYSKTVDEGNYSVVCDAFSSSTGRSQVAGFIRSCR